jgi:acyl-CoA thioester hydrolase
LLRRVLRGRASIRHSADRPGVRATFFATFLKETIIVTAATPSDPTDAALYRYWIDEHVRFADLDPLGHANNSAISTYFESGRVALFTELSGPLVQPDRPSVVVVRVAIDFRTELRYADRIRIGLKVGRIGRTSIVLEGGIFRGDTCAATSEAVCVLFDLVRRCPVEVPEDQRALLREYA